MRVAIITESFPPDVNGVAHCVRAAAEFERIGAGNLVRVPLGVDLATFTPGASQVRAQDQVLLVHVAGQRPGRRRPGHF
jgi:hypothetical protein